MNKVTRRLLAGAAIVLFPIVALALDEPFRNTVTGDVLDITQTPKEGRDTEAVKKFMETGHNPYNDVKECLPRGEYIFLSSCSGCHGHLAEGKVGPGLNDNYWTYPKNTTDKGMFETIFGGAQGMMGPHNDLQLNEILLAMAWIRHLYTGPVEGAKWLTKEQKANFTPYKQPEGGEHGGTIDDAKAAPVDKCGPLAE
jgi:cytochrome c-L